MTVESESSSGHGSGDNQHRRILFGLLFGVAFGLAARQLSANLSPDGAAWITFAAQRVAAPLGQVFLRIVMMVVIPLVFSALCVGVLEIGDVRKLGRIGLKTLAVTALFSISAVLIGVVLVNAIKPGAGLDADKLAMLEGKFKNDADKTLEQANKSAEKKLETRLLDILPANPLQEAVGAIDGSSPGNGMLSIMAFALVFGIALTTIRDKAEPLIRVLEATFAVTMAIIGFAMRLAPFAVGCLMFSVTVTLGTEFLFMLARFVLVVLLGLTLHFVVVYSLALKFLARRSPLEFFRAANDAIVTSFATSSSNATLPVSLRVAQEDLGIPPRIAQFVLTVGATGNQNGTALYEGVVVLFLAQVFHVELSIVQQSTVVLMAVLAGIGTAGIPGGSLPLIVGILQSIKVQGGSIALILGVDRFLDMARTVLNVVGDLVVAACVAYGEPDEPETEVIAS